MAGKKAGEVAGKSEANQVRAKVGEKAAGSRAAEIRHRCGTMPSGIDHSQTSGKFHFDPARFFRAALAPSLPRAVRVFFGRCAIVLFRRAARAAFLMFRFAAARCFLVVTSSTEPDLSLVGPSCAPRATLRLSAGASACALLSSRRPNASVPSVAPPRASRVWTMPALMLSDGSRA